MFRLQSKAVFLTYPACNKDPNDLLLFLLDKLPNATRVRTAQEHHNDGSLHCHAAILCSKRMDIKSASFFDFDGSHCNIQKCKSFNKSWAYLAKEENHCDYEEEQSEEDYKHPSEFESKFDYLEYSMAKGTSFGYANEFWKLHSSVTPPIITETTEIEGTINPVLYFNKPSLNKTTLLIGPSGIGKTTWAKREATKPALFVSHIDDLKKVTIEVKCVIFDDMDFTHWPRTSQIHLVDSDNARTINVRYGTVHLPAGLQKIFTANSRPFLIDEAIERRLYTINLLE